MRYAKTAVVLASILLWVTGPVPPAGAGDLTVTTAPTEVTLVPGGSTTGVLLLANGGTKRAAVLVRTLPSDASITVTMQIRRAVVFPGGARALTFTATRASEGTGQAGRILFIAAYSQAKSKTARRTRHVVVTPIAVNTAASPELVQVAIASKIDTINENRPGEAELVITNPRAAPVRIDRLHVRSPGGVDTTLACPDSTDEHKAEEGKTTEVDCAFTIAGLSQEVVPLAFATRNAVTPGPRSALVQVDAEDPARDGASQTVVATTDFKVDVFAESDILKAIGVPIFLLLPGVLIVVVSWFLIQFLSPWRRLVKDHKLGDVISVSTPTFVAIVGLAISLGMAAVYPVLTQHLWPPHYRRDYVHAYGFRDFYYVFFFSFAIAIAVWLGSLLAYAVVRPLLFLPWLHDDASDILRKLGLRGLPRSLVSRLPRVGKPSNAFREHVTVTESGKEAIAPKWPGVGDTLFVVPRMKFVAGSPVDALQGSDITNETDVFRLWLLVKRSKGVLAFDNKVSIPEVEFLERTKLQSTGPGHIIDIASSQ